MTPVDHALHHPEPVAHDDGAHNSGAEDGALGFTFRIYKSLLSPILHAISPSRCLYLPTCSEYAYTAVRRFGVVRGSWMALRRFARCHPWGKGGLDPVPERVSTVDSTSVQPATNRSGQKAADHLP
jgi:putative membrane protein insertion efficiency factor